MSLMDFTTAFYIKLGRGGEWEADSIETGKLRLGWRHQSVEDINARRWEVIEEQLRAKDEGKRVAATTSDLNALKILTDSCPEDLWITFHQSKLWWTRLAPGPVEQDKISKFRLTAQPWSDQAADGRLLVTNALPGKISQLQGFRATVCRVNYVGSSGILVGDFSLSTANNHLFFLEKTRFRCGTKLVTISE